MSEAAISSAARWFNSASGAVALNMKSGTHYCFNKTGTMVWLALVESSSRAEIETYLCAQFHISPERAKLDLGNLLNKLEKAGLLDLVESGFKNGGASEDYSTEARASTARSRDEVPEAR